MVNEPAQARDHLFTDCGMRGRLSAAAWAPPSRGA
jgi:hypothetical protein